MVRSFGLARTFALTQVHVLHAVLRVTLKVKSFSFFPGTVLIVKEEHW
jgi:hypothetical protein